MARGKVTKTRRKVRLSVPESAPAPTSLPEGWVLGKTCLTCKTTYNFQPMPLFQEEGAKDGTWDVTRQLPHCAKGYPLCERCLPWHWRNEAKRYGVEKQFLKMYDGYFT